MFRILLVHNYYGSGAPSGENHVFEAEQRLLEQNGHKVDVFVRQSDEIRAKGKVGLLLGGMATPWNPWMANAMRRKVGKFKPDVVHIHNTFPLISPAIFHAIGHRAARVLTLHNYRLFCPAAIPMRNGKVCTECLDSRHVWSSLKYGCYRESRIATIPLALSVALHRSIGTWQKHVEAFITLSEFQRETMINAGLQSEKVCFKPNFYPGNPDVVPWTNRESYIVYAGRLSAEKGVETLIRAWQLWGSDAPELRIVGAGPLQTKLKRATKGMAIRFLGRLSLEQTHMQIARAKLLILPSEWFETFGMVVIEALAFGTPAAVSDIGALPSIVHHGVNGVVFKPADPESLVRKVRSVWDKPGVLEKMGKSAYKDFQTKYSDEINYRALINIYKKVIRK